MSPRTPPEPAPDVPGRAAGPASCCGPPGGKRALGASADPSGAGVPPLPGPGPQAGSDDGLVALAGGAFWMGSEDPDGFASDGEGPVREVTLAPFLIEATAVTNAAFAAFIGDTGYVTEAQRFGWSYVFRGHLSQKFARGLRAVPGVPWWVAVPGARWDRPLGERSSLSGLEDHPVVHVSWHDAAAYAAWAGRTLPTEAQWEFAARGGTDRQTFPWGDRLEPRGRHRCNVFQGRFPEHDTAADGFAGTCPVDAFTPNAYGLHNMVGNVWEWTADWFSPVWHAEDRPETRVDPVGPRGGPGHDTVPMDTTGQRRRVQKGGSFLCHRSYCNRYRLGARTANVPDSSTTNAGFRCVRSG